jgi:hypothetical protein
LRSGGCARDEAEQFLLVARKIVLSQRGERRRLDAERLAGGCDAESAQTFEHERAQVFGAIGEAREQ